MKFHVLTLFPEMVRQGLETSIIGRAVERGLIRLNTVNIRDFTLEKHGRVDDYPYGGGAGMLMQAQPVFDAWKSVCGSSDGGAGDKSADGDKAGSGGNAVAGDKAVAGESTAAGDKTGPGGSAVAGESIAAESGGTAAARADGGRRLRTIYVTPQGEPFTQKKAREFAGEEELVILCGHYEGIDERVLEEVVTDYISIGDYVLTGGELAAMVIVDAVGRLVPGVLGNEISAEAESFHGDLLEYPQYSRPEVWHGKKVPEVLLSGDHAKVDCWRLEKAKERTASMRPDLYQKYEERQALIKVLSKDKRNQIHIMESLAAGRGEILYRKEREALVCDRDAKICMLSVRGGSGRPEAPQSEETESDGVVGGRPEAPQSGETESGRRAGGRLNALLSAVPEETEWLAVPEGRLAEELEQGGFGIWGKYSQYLYTARQTLPVHYRDIRRLGIVELDYVSGHLRRLDIAECPLGDGAFPGQAAENSAYNGESSRQEAEIYLQERIRAGAMYGAFADGRQIGFAGIHRGGGMGLLYVEKEYRRQGIGKALLSYMINRTLEQGRVPYLHLRSISGKRDSVSESAQAMEQLLENLRLYRADREVWWLRRRR